MKMDFRDLLVSLAFVSCLHSLAHAAPKNIHVQGTLRVTPPGSRGQSTFFVTDDGHVGVGTNEPNVLGVKGRWLSVLGKGPAEPGFVGAGSLDPTTQSGAIAGGFNFFNGPFHAGEIQAINSSGGTTDDTHVKIMTRTGGHVYDTIFFGGPGEHYSSYATAGQSCRILKGEVNVVYDAVGVGSGAQATFPTSGTALLAPFRSSITTEAGLRTTENLVHFFHNRAELGPDHTVTREIAFQSDGRASGGNVENFAVVADNRDFSGEYFIHSNSGLPSKIAGVVKVTGQLVAKGTQTADDANEGYIGQYLESTVVDPAPLPGVSGTFGDACQLTLTPGDWNVTAMVYLFADGTTLEKSPHMGISTMEGQPSDLDLGINAATISSPLASNELSMVVPGYRMSLAETTHVIQKVEAMFSNDPPKFRCRLSARRVR